MFSDKGGMPDRIWMPATIDNADPAGSSCAAPLVELRRSGGMVVHPLVEPVVFWEVPLSELRIRTTFTSQQGKRYFQGWALLSQDDLTAREIGFPQARQTLDDSDASSDACSDTEGATFMDIGAHLDAPEGKKGS